MIWLLIELATVGLICAGGLTLMLVHDTQQRRRAK